MMNQGKSSDNSEAVANLVDIKRTVDAQREIASTLSADSPDRAALLKTAKVLSDGLLSKDIYFERSVTEILPNGVTRMSDENMAANGIGFKNTDFQNKSSDYLVRFTKSQAPVAMQPSYTQTGELKAIGIGLRTQLKH